jgi:YidC/Oxa1 family membrane protein insertase
LFYVLSNPFTLFFKNILLWLHDAFAHVGLPASVSPFVPALVLMAVLVKALTYPLNRAQQRSMRGLQEIQPKLRALQEQHKDDKEVLAQKQLELYREHQVNPLGGCLPLIVQMVVFFGLFAALRELSGQPAAPGPMVGEQFLWIPNLAACEPNPLCPANKAMAIPILALVLFVTQLAFQKMMTPPVQSDDPQAQAMATSMKFLPILFAYFSLTFAAGFSIYYIVFNILSLVQQKWLTPMGPAAAVVVAGTGEAGKADGDRAAASGRGRRSREERFDERRRR